MKKLLMFVAATMLFASCTVNRSSVQTTMVQPEIETKTKATLVVSPKRVSYTYVPTKTNSKNLSIDQLVQNATYMALQANGNADVMVKVNYNVVMKWSLFGKRVKSISLSGYPAHYRDFREVE